MIPENGNVNDIYKTMFFLMFMGLCRVEQQWIFYFLKKKFVLSLEISIKFFFILHFVKKKLILNEIYTVKLL